MWKRGVQRLVARSRLEQDSVRRILDTSSASIDRLQTRWTSARDAIVEQLDFVGGIPEDRDQASPEQRAVLRQLDRHDGEYLLRELSGGGFLPSHGFPLPRDSLRQHQCGIDHGRAGRSRGQRSGRRAFSVPQLSVSGTGYCHSGIRARQQRGH